LARCARISAIRSEKECHSETANDCPPYS
jgi:hypothetical protein